MRRYPTVLYWFRRALRLDDNRGLVAAVGAAEQVVPVFVIDPTILVRPDIAPIRVRFLFQGLAELDADLRARGSRLVLRSGNPQEEIPRLAREIGAGAVFFAREYEPFGRSRDAVVTRALEEIGVGVETFSDHLLIEPGVLRTNSGSVHTVFTPFRKRWEAAAHDAPIGAPARIVTPAQVASAPLPALPETAAVAPVAAGERAANALLKRFVAEAVSSYDTLRDLPGRAGTSRLSASLRFGMISPRRIRAALLSQRQVTPTNGGRATFLSELAWRDFFYQILACFPQVAERSFRPAFDRIRWENDARLLAAWEKGETGYPFIDAAMRELNATGWMHNRARMAVASFVTRDLLIDWRLGERVFMQRLVDGDQAANNGGWQWAAGTGTDAQPYFRIFHPVRQGQRFDPMGAYVRRWVPELAAVPDRFVHCPWELSGTEQEAVGCILGKDYPSPVVEHARQRERALTLYRAAAEEKE